VPLECLVVGTNDLARETGVRLKGGRVGVLPWLSQCVVAARAYGLAVLDGTFNDLNDWEGFHAECEQGRDLGMDGKTLIHPRQVAMANEVFSPSAEEVAWAEKVLAAFNRPENATKAVIAVEGQMVERLHEQMAHRVLETATAILPPE
jgi:citrate lyase subunit beta/citryl-CoA lyase